MVARMRMVLTRGCRGFRRPVSPSMCRRWRQRRASWVARSLRHVAIARATSLRAGRSGVSMRGARPRARSVRNHSPDAAHQITGTWRIF